MYFHARHDYQNSVNYFDGFPLFNSSQQSVILREISLMFLLRKLKTVLLCATRSLCLICSPSACDGCGAPFSTEHVLNCHNDGLVGRRYNGSMMFLVI